MGRGNVCVHGKYEGLFYIDNEHLNVYRRADDYDEYPETRLMGELDYAELTSGDWLYDGEGTMCEEDDVLECFVDSFTRRFPSFERARGQKWVGDSCRVILESKLSTSWSKTTSGRWRLSSSRRRSRGAMSGWRTFRRGCTRSISTE